MDTLDDLFRRLEQLNEIGAALSHERNLDRLLERILLAAKQITHADGGTLYRMTEDGRHLRFEIVRTDSLAIAFGAALGYLVMGLMHSALAGFTVSGLWFLIFSGYHVRKARAYSAVAVA